MKGYSSIRLEVTSHCNLKCEYCHNAEHSNKNDDMTTTQILKLIENLKRVYPINKILITGGEPLMKNDIFEIIRRITDLGIKADMVTNATLLNDTVIKKLDETGLKRIRLSIDDVGEKSTLRSYSNPDFNWKVAKRITEISNIEVCIHTVCSPYNVRELFEVYNKVLESGAKRWRVFDLGYQGALIKNSNEFNFDEYYDDFINVTKKILSHYLDNNLSNILDIEINNIFRTIMLKSDEDDEEVKIEELLALKSNVSPCDYVTEHQLSIRSNGIATLCQYFHNKLFDFADNDFDVTKAISNYNTNVENELLMKDLTYCMNCKYCLVCNSGCRSKAQFLTGDIKDADPTACYIFPKIKNEIIPILPIAVQEKYNSYINYTGLEPKYGKADLLNFLKMKGYSNE